MHKFDIYFTKIYFVIKAEGTVRRADILLTSPLYPSLLTVTAATDKNAVNYILARSVSDRFQVDGELERKQFKGGVGLSPKQQIIPVSATGGILRCGGIIEVGHEGCFFDCRFLLGFSIFLIFFAAVSSGRMISMTLRFTVNWRWVIRLCECLGFFPRHGKDFSRLNASYFY